MSKRNFFLLFVVAALLLVANVIPIKSNPDPETTLIAGRNVNMVSGTTFPDGDPYLQRQNEPSIAVSTRNPLHLLAGANDYRSISIAMEDKLPGYQPINQAPAPDAWLGVFKSIDGGSTWKSTLLPGFYYYDTTPPGAPPSPLYGFSAAADPVVRSGPNGLFFYAGIVFNREDRGESAVFVSRFIDNNNKENVDTAAYIDTQIQARGSAGQFIDKPWLAVDVPYPEAPSIPVPSPDPNNGTQYVTRCNVYLTYSVFLGNPDINIRTKNYFVRSTDSGMTWENPIKLSETQHINQGTVIAVDPRGNGHVWVAWRRFAHINNKGEIIQPDGIVVVKSEDAGATFTQPFVVHEMAPWFPPSDNGVFDQATTPESFRTNDYPTMAVDHNGTVYIAWTQRGLGPNTDPGTGEARIVMTASNNGVDWTEPAQVISYMEGDPPGHQLMPQLTYAAGKLTLLWYDLRWDVIRIFLPFIEDIYVNARHTIDVRVAQAEIQSYPQFSPSIQVSKYPFVIFPREDDPDVFLALQLFYDRPNLKLFSLGTVPFMGDYIGIAPSPMFLSPEDPKNTTGHWIYNSDPTVPTVYHAVWTDNRDVVHPHEILDLPGEDPVLGEWNQYNAPGEGCGDGNWTGIRNQNIYTSRISEGILAGSPGNTKPLNILRSFIVFVQNASGEWKDFILRIQKPGNMEAYFPETGSQESEILSVPPHSYVSKTILVEDYSEFDVYASIIIEVYEIDEVGSETYVSYVTLNPDSTNPWLDESEGVDPGNPHPRNEGETHSPHPRNYAIVEWNYEQNDPYINTIRIDYEGDEAIVNNDGITPYPVMGDVDNPHGRNPHGRNPNPANPHGRNNILNPHGRNTNLSDIADGSKMVDVVRTIENAGNTTTSYSINTYETPEDLPDGILAQLLVFKTYTTPAVDIFGGNGCELIEQELQELVVNLTPHPRNPEDPTPHPRNLSELGDVSVNVPPKGVFHVLYRFYNPHQTPEQQEFHAEEKYEDAVPDIESDTPDTAGDVIVGPPPKLLVIPPQTLPNGVVGDPSYSATIQAEGGTGTYGNWTIIEGALPGSLSLDPNSGVISGDLLTAVAGKYIFKVEVNDLDEEGYPVQAATKTLSILVISSLNITKTTLYDAFRGGGYVDILLAAGGTEPYIWSIIAGSLPDGLALTPGTNIIEGIVSQTAVTETFTVQVTDSGYPTLTDTLQMTIDVYNPPQITTSSPLPNGNTGTAYSIILSGTGGNTPYTWSVFSGTLPPGLSLNSSTGEISGTPTSPGAYQFQIHMTDSSNPNQTDGRNFSISIDITGLIAHYPFNGNANDASGNGNHGTIFGGATFTEDRFGNSNGAIDLDGSNDYVELPNESTFDLTEFTIYAIVKVPVYIRNYVISKGSNFGNYTIMFHSLSDGNPGQASYAHQTQGGNWSAGVTNNPVPLNEFFHIAVVLTPTTFNSYLNGNPQATSVPSPPVLNNENVTIGALRDSGVPAYFFNGAIDEIRIYNQALTPSEIEALYDAESGFVTEWGSQGSGDGQFNYPLGIAVDSSGYVYVVDNENYRIQKFTSDGVFVTKWGSQGSGDGQFQFPEGIAVDSSGYVYVTDSSNNRVQKFDSDGVFQTKWGTLGDGPGEFNYPMGIAVDSSGPTTYVYVTEDENNRVQKFDSDGNYIGQWGTPGSGNGQFNFPEGIAVDGSGYVYVTDANNDRVQKFDSDGNYISQWGTSGSGDGEFDYPMGITVDSSGYVYVTEDENSRVQKFTSDGVFVTKWGSYGTGKGQFRFPEDVAVDSSGYIYVTDANNNRVQKFKLDG